MSDTNQIKKYSGLTPAQDERLDKLIEECAEVIKACTKIKRHGYFSYNPDDPNHLGNKFDLECEIQDVMNAVTLLYEKGDIDWHFEFPAKFYSMNYMHHQKDD